MAVLVNEVPRSGPEVPEEDGRPRPVVSQPCEARWHTGGTDRPHQETLGPRPRRDHRPAALGQQQHGDHALSFLAARAHDLTGQGCRPKPEILDALAAYRKNVVHEQPSSGKLAQAFMRDPNNLRVIFTYESRIPESRKKWKPRFYLQPIRGAGRPARPWDIYRRKAWRRYDYLPRLARKPAGAGALVASDKLALRARAAPMCRSATTSKSSNRSASNAVRPGRDVVQAILHEATKKDRQ